MKRPNILLILIDDMGWRDTGCYGSPFYETPNVDGLAGEGMRFTDAYAACPVCSPTRASILTGKYPARLGLTNYIAEFGEHPARGRLIDAPYVDHLPLTERNLARTLKAAGYATWHVGKWHLGAEPYWPERQGFEVNVGGCDWGHPHQGFFCPWGIPTLEDRTEGEYLTDRLTDEAIQLIRGHGDRPFFLYLPYYAVHVPIEAKEHLVEKYRRKAASLGLDAVQAFAEGDYFPCEHKKDRRVLRRLIQSDPAYAAMIETLDGNIGRLLRTLEETGKSDDTVVIFTSDNGGAGYLGLPEVNQPYRGWKITFFEGGIRVPLFMQWPAVIPAGVEFDRPVHHFDIYATAASAAGAPLPGDRIIDGVDLLPYARQEREGEPHRALFWRSGHYQVVQSQGWKLQRAARPERVWLFDMNNDPTEQREVSAAQPGKVAELLALLNEHNASQAEPMWPSRAELPVLIDKTLAEPQDPTDEYVYVPN